MKLELFYEAKPWKVNQEWGVFNPVYNQFGFSRHNGVDIALGSDKRLRAPFECEVTKIAYQPGGAGTYICLLSLNQYEFDDAKAWVEMTYMHLEKTLVPVGKKLFIGEAFAVADNTGFSTGPHTHIAAKRVNKVNGGYVEIDKNEAKNTFNDEKFRNGKYAYDYGISRIWNSLQELALKVAKLIKK